MAAIAIGDCTTTVETPLSGVNLWKIVTPATADDGDTVDISTIVATPYSATCTAATDGLIPVALITQAGVLTIPGATDNEARTIYVFGK